VKKIKDLEPLPSFSFGLTQLEEERNVAGEIRATSPVKSHRNHVAMKLAG